MRREECEGVWGGCHMRLWFHWRGERKGKIPSHNVFSDKGDIDRDRAPYLTPLDDPPVWCLPKIWTATAD